MLFNTIEYIFIFLPVVVILFYLIGARGHHRSAAAWLFLTSLFFYGWWNPKYVILLAGSILFNYAIGMLFSSRLGGKCLLAFGITINLGLLAYYKYASFFIENLDAAFGVHYSVQTIFLPLAISFFTFQQIAFLIDTYRSPGSHPGFLQYGLFVTFFPQLIAGPIVHHKEMMPQFDCPKTYHWKAENFSIGCTIFIIGLLKKVVIADHLSIYVTPVFNAADYSPHLLSLLEAWGAAMAYTLQLYFDFSGYADMAIGSALLFGIRIPENFNSPYKSVNIIEFWRRWHITLSRFLKDYLYIPLGGNRKGPIRRYANLFTTMLLGGLWHGAGWSFIIWGGLHGIYLAINHLWIYLRKTWLGQDTAKSTRGGTLCSIAITFLSVVLAWVFFRAETFSGAIHILKGMAGFNGIALPERFLILHPSLGQLGIKSSPGVGIGYFSDILGFGWIFLALMIAWFMPNTYQYMQGHTKRFPFTIQWKPNMAYAFITAILFFASMIYMNHPSEFLYFQF